MFNFSANHMLVTAKRNYSRCSVYFIQDMDTKRCYKTYDYTLNLDMRPGSVYCISGKVNSADKLYLIAESCKIDTRFMSTGNYSVVKGQQ
jgi:hypothetical protein